MVTEGGNRFAGEHLVIFRTSGSLLDPNSYNCQEIGLAKALRKRGLAVTVVMAGRENASITVGENGCDLSVIFRNYRSINQELAWFDDMSGLLEELNPTIVQIHDLGMLMSWRVARWCRKRGVPVCLVQGGYELTRKPVFRQLESLFNHTFGKSILRNVNAIGCKTPGASRFIARYSTKPTIITPVGLDASRFTDCCGQDWRKRLNLPDDAKLLLYVGVLSRRRHPLFMLDVLSRLPDNYNLVIVGTGELEPEIKSKVEDPGLCGRLVLTGQLSQSDLPALYRCADLFMLPSDYEIYGMVILESMYYGLPVMAYSTAGAELLISSGSDGLIRSDYDADAWACDIRQCLDDNDAINRMGRNASEKIRDMFLWDRVADSFLSLYDQARQSVSEE